MSKVLSKILCLFIFLLYKPDSSNCHCLEDEDFTMIYASENQVFVRYTRANNAVVTKRLTEFARDITGLATYKDCLFVSVTRSGLNKKDSGIWRVNGSKIFSNFQVDNNSWKEFHVLNTVASNVLSMVIAEGYIYAGRCDRIMWRCSADEPNSCENFNQFSSPISNIEYSPVDGQVYAVANGKIKRCSPYSAYSCHSVSISQDVTAVKAAFGAIWFGTKSGLIWKCHLNNASYTSTPIEENCIVLDELDFNYIKYLGASKKYLYVNLEPSKFIWRCDPEKIWSCSREIKAPKVNEMSPFIIV